MGPGILASLGLVGVAIFAVASRWHEAFGIFGVSSLATSAFYGLVWFLKWSEFRSYQQLYGFEAPPYLHTPVTDLLMGFQVYVLSAVWGIGAILFIENLKSKMG